MILRNEHLIGVANKTYKNIDSSELSSSDKSYATLKQTEQFTKKGQQLRLDFIEDNTNTSLNYISQIKSFDGHEDLKGNIENFIGMSQIPTGILGPIVIEGGSAKGSFYVPLATSEGTLVASYNRGGRACRESGMIRSVCLKEGVQRSPIFKFKNLDQVAEFLGWISKEQVQFGKIVAQTSNYAQLINIDTNIEGNQVILNLSFTTGDAAGQNMVTLATHAICAYIEQNNPVKPDLWFIESNFSGDKKATVNSFVNVRGKKVSSEIVLKKEVVNEVLKTTPQLMFEYWQTSFMGAVKCGAIGAQGHFSNGLAAIFGCSHCFKKYMRILQAQKADYSRNMGAELRKMRSLHPKLS